MKKILLLIFLFGSLLVHSQQIPEMDEKDTAAMIKASYLYNFAKLIDWPEAYKSGNFIISVMGSSNLHKELVKKYNSKQIGSQQIEIRKLSPTLNISKCHILYVGTECISMLPQIAEALKGKPILIVTDYDGSLENGSALNFEFVNGQWRYVLKLKNAVDRDLYIGSTLKSLALKVE